MSPTRNRRRSRTALLLTVGVVAVAAAAWFFAPRLSGSPAADGSSASSASSAAAGSAGAEGVAATTPAPYTIKPEPSVVATDPPVKRSGHEVQVVLTYSGFDEVSHTVQANGFVAGVIEDGGTCTLTLTRDGATVTATSTAAADATTTSCGLLQTPTGLAAGAWTAVLAYSSRDASGSSQAMGVTVR